MTVFHPELRPGEIFLGNFRPDSFARSIEWPSKRMGIQAYDLDGKKFPQFFGWRPVFALRSELEAANVFLDR